MDKSIFQCDECTFETGNDESAQKHMHETTHAMTLMPDVRKVGGAGKEGEKNGNYNAMS